MSDTNRAAVVRAVAEAGVVAVLRVTEPGKLFPVIDALAEGGVTAHEITLTVPGAIEQIREAKQRYGDDIVLGVGSVLDAETATRAVEAGANYVVSPVFKPSIIEAAHAAGAAAMPGCFTPTEIQLATEAGADVCKVFPANVVGMGFFKAVLAPMPHLKLMPTGGVSLTNAGDWAKAGAVAVGVGSALMDKAAIASGDYAVLTQNARVIMASLAEGRG
jgi:2-dehydro-3-deoxyphosphogluconate aldolase/(4S)-4-hydroxy-2-oxoglutarate aldolase